MYKIVKKEQLTENIVSMDLYAPRVANSAKAGQFCIVKANEKGERVPLTICDMDEEAGTVNIVFQTVGDSTKKMDALNEGDYFADFVGPLGVPSDLYGKTKEELNEMKIILIGGGVGTAPVYPQAKYLNSLGVDFDVIIATRSKDTLILEDKMKEVCKNVHVSTDDGSYGFNGNGSQLLEDLVKNQGREFHHAVVIGPVIMMKFTSMAVKNLGIESCEVSMNSMMVDGTGMCGACRVKVGDEIKFTCVDGPEFDGFKVDYDLAMKRMAMYKDEEQRKILREEEIGTHGGNPYCECEEGK